MPMTKDSLKNLSREEKINLIKSVGIDEIKKLPREKKIKLIESLQGLGNAKPPGDSARALRVGIEQGGTLGFRPIVAGLAAGAGGAVGELERGGSLSDALRVGKQSFGEARKESREEQEALAKTNQGPMIAGQLIGSVPTLPFTAVKGLKGATVLGGVGGLGEGLSSAEKLSDVPVETLKGAAGGLALGTGFKAGGLALKKTGNFVGNLETVQRFKDAAKDTFSKVGEAVSGVPKRQIKTLIEQGDDVVDLIKNSDGDLTGAADALRRKLMKGIQDTRQKANAAITSAIQKSPNNKIVDTAPAELQVKGIINQLEPIVNRNDISSIETLIIKELKNVSKGKGLTLKQAQALKQYFDSLSKDTYTKSGKIFANSNAVKRSAKAAAGELRTAINELSPEIQKANGTLRTLRTIEQNINKNLIGEGRSDAALFAVGGGTNQRNEALIRRLGTLTGVDSLNEARKLSAARQFADSKLVTFDVTGKGVERAGKGALVGGLIGGVPGAVTGALLTSPAAIQSLVRSGQLTTNVAKKIFKDASPKVQSLLIQQFGKDNFNEPKQ